jgi:hypothetical protein
VPRSPFLQVPIFQGVSESGRWAGVFARTLRVHARTRGGAGHTVLAHQLVGRGSSQSECLGRAGNVPAVGGERPFQRGATGSSNGRFGRCRRSVCACTTSRRSSKRARSLVSLSRRTIREWLLERHGHRIPGRGPASADEEGGVIMPPTCLGNRDRYTPILPLAVSLVALYTELSGGWCLTHIGREGSLD